MDRQGGVFTAAQARAVGHTDSQLQVLRRRKILVSVRRGVYAWSAVYVSADPQTQHRIACAAVRLTPGGAGGAEPSERRRHPWTGDARRRPVDVVHVTRGDTSGARQEAGVHHHVAEIPDEHVARSVRMLSTSPPSLGPRSTSPAAPIGTSALSPPSTLPCGWAFRCPSCAQSSIAAAAGRARASSSTALDFADGRAANPGESWSRVVLASAGSRTRRPAGGGLRRRRASIGYVDFGWKGVVGEFDGRYKYGLGRGPVPLACPTRSGRRSGERTGCASATRWSAGLSPTCTSRASLGGPGPRRQERARRPARRNCLEADVSRCGLERLARVAHRARRRSITFTCHRRLGCAGVRGWGGG